MASRTCFHNVMVEEMIMAATLMMTRVMMMILVVMLMAIIMRAHKARECSPTLRSTMTRIMVMMVVVIMKTLMQMVIMRVHNCAIREGGSTFL